MIFSCYVTNYNSHLVPFVIFSFRSTRINHLTGLSIPPRPQGLITAGLLVSPAARASFLTQTSVVMTPLISAMAGERIRSSVWGGCALALFGLFLISTSGGTTATAAAGGKERDPLADLRRVKKRGGGGDGTGQGAG